MARITKILGFIFLTLSSGLFFILTRKDKVGINDYSDLGGVYVACIVVFILGLFIWRKSKRYIAKNQKPIDLDSDPFVLYLRPFSEDTQRMKTYSSYLLAPSMPFNLTTQEENLARVVKLHGTLAAIGSPKDLLPHLGAKRLYFENHEWKDVVLYALKKAKLIILRAGETPGFRWELEQVLSLKDKRNVIILMPGKEEEYQKMCYLINSSVPMNLPEFSYSFFRSNEMNCIIYFDKNNKPKFFFPKWIYWQLIRFDPNARAIQKCLKQRKLNLR